MKFAATLCAMTVASLTAAGPAAAANPVVHPLEWPRPARAFTPDARLEARIDTLVARMTPKEKVGQLIQADIENITPDDLRHFPLGSVLNGADVAPGNDKLASPREWLELVDRFYEATEGSGVADVLFRSPDGAVAHDFRGRLPLPWPRKPAADGAAARGGPFFPYGYGLTYAVKH